MVTAIARSTMGINPSRFGINTLELGLVVSNVRPLE